MKTVIVGRTIWTAQLFDDRYVTFDKAFAEIEGLMHGRDNAQERSKLGPAPGLAGLAVAFSTPVGPPSVRGTKQ